MDIKEILAEKLKTLVPIDNEVFCYMASDKRFCQEFLRVILQDDNLVVVENDTQKFLPNLYLKDAIVDMCCKLGDGRIVNVEVQLYNEKEHAKRIFYYASMLRQSSVAKGVNYDELKDIIIIYLTKDDIFKKGSTIYNVEMNIVSDAGEKISKWNAGLNVLYVNTKGITNKNINEYLKLLTDKETKNTNYKITSEIKTDIFETGGANMSKWMQDLIDEGVEKNKQTWMQRGMQQGIERGMQSTIDKLVAAGLIKREDAEKQLSLA